MAATHLQSQPPVAVCSAPQHVDFSVGSQQVSLAFGAQRAAAGAFAVAVGFEIAFVVIMSSVRTWGIHTDGASIQTPERAGRRTASAIGKPDAASIRRQAPPEHGMVCVTLRPTLEQVTAQWRMSSLQTSVLRQVESSGLVVMDVDPGHGGETSLRKLQR